MTTMLELRQEARDAVSHPGKFEGESPMTFILWELTLEGGVEDEYAADGIGWWGRVGKWLVHESDQGFVSAWRYASHEEAQDALYTISQELEGELFDNA